MIAITHEDKVCNKS